jgi:hypothetical protein
MTSGGRAFVRITEYYRAQPVTHMKGITVVNFDVESVITFLATVIGIAVGGAVAFTTHNVQIGVVVTVLAGASAWLFLRAIGSMLPMLTKRTNGQENLLEIGTSYVLVTCVLLGVGVVVGALACIISPVFGL